MSAPTGTVRRLLALATTMALLLAVSALTRVPYETARDTALLRLAWRARGELIERCRRATPEELAQAAAHMRQEVICERGRVAPYTLQVHVDGRALVDGPVDGSGAQGEGTLYVLHELALAPGAHRVQVRFARGAVEGTDDDEDDGDEDDDALVADSSARGRKRHAIPPLLVLDTTIVVPAGRVALVTYVPEAERLVLLGAAESAAESSGTTSGGA